MKKEAGLFLLVFFVFTAVLIVGFVLADSYTSQSPSNNAYQTQQDVNFSVNVSFYGDSGASLENISLWLGQSDGFVLNSTNLTTNAFEIDTANNTFYNFSVVMNEGVYNWTFSVTVDGTTTLNSSNYTVTVDLFAPNASLLLPVSGNYSGGLLFNASANDTSAGTGVVNVSYGYERPGYSIAWVTDSRSAEAWNATFDTTSIDDGNWNISVNATDAAGNSNITYNITEVIIDNNAPNASIKDPVNNSNFSMSVFLNASVNDTGTGVLFVSFGYQNHTSQITWVVANYTGSDFWNYTINFSELVDAEYNLSINATDFLNNSNVAYNTTSFVFDTTPPLEAPVLVASNVSDHDDDGNVEINWSDIDDETAETYIVYRFTGEITELNGSLTNVTVNRVEKGVMYFEDNTTTGNNATEYWYAVVAVDAAGNLNTSTGAVNLSSSFNSTANDTVMPESPTNLNYTASSGAVIMNWLSSVNDVRGSPDSTGIKYRLYRNAANGVANLSRYSYVNTSDSNFGVTTQVGGDISTNSTSFDLTENGTYIFIVTSVDDNGNENLSYDTSISAPNLLNITVTISSGSGDGGTTSGGGGGGSGSGSGTSDPDAGTSQSRLWDKITAGSTATFNITKSGIPFTYVSFKVTEEANDVELTVTKLSSRPSSVPAYSGTVHSYVSITKSGLKDTAVSYAVIEFKIERKWFTANNGLAKNIVLVRYDRNEWNELPLNITDMDANTYFFRAESPGLSTFAIVLKEVLVEASAGEAVADSGADANASQNINDSAAPVSDVPKGKALLYTAILIIVVALAAGIAGFIYYRKSKNVLGGESSVSETPQLNKPDEKLEERPKV